MKLTLDLVKEDGEKITSVNIDESQLQMLLEIAVNRILLDSIKKHEKKGECVMKEFNLYDAFNFLVKLGEYSESGLVKKSDAQNVVKSLVLHTLDCLNGSDLEKDFDSENECKCESKKKEEEDIAPDYSIYPNSSWIENVSYDPTKEEFTLITQEGSAYVYKNVPEELWDDLLDEYNSGQSIGDFYNKNIKGQYDRLY